MSIGVQRSGPAIRKVLAELAPDELVDFEAEFRVALAETDDDFDLARVEAVITKWWGIAHLRLHPPTAGEMAAIQQANDGDFTGLYQEIEPGNWVQLSTSGP
jgi:hypothetical protein